MTPVPHRLLSRAHLGQPTLTEGVGDDMGGMRCPHNAPRLVQHIVYLVAG